MFNASRCGARRLGVNNHISRQLVRIALRKRRRQRLLAMQQRANRVGGGAFTSFCASCGDRLSTLDERDSDDADDRMETLVQGLFTFFIVHKELNHVFSQDGFMEREDASSAAGFGGARRRHHGEAAAGHFDPAAAMGVTLGGGGYRKKLG